MFLKIQFINYNNFLIKLIIFLNHHIKELRSLTIFKDSWIIILSFYNIFIYIILAHSNAIFKIFYVCRGRNFIDKFETPSRYDPCRGYC